MAVTAYSFLTAAQVGPRAVGDYLRFRCDTEAELPSSDVQNGDQAVTLDSKKCWTRSGGSWVEDSSVSIARWGNIIGTLSNQTDLQDAIDNAGGPAGSEETGVCKVWLTGTPPTGYLLCDGSAVSRATYSALFAVISTTFGVGDGSSTFNLPNMKGRVVCGYDSSQTEFDALGKTGGAKTHTLTSAEMPSHTHVQDSHNHTQNAHSHVINSQTATTGSATSYEHGALDTSSAEAEATEVTATTVATNQVATAVNQNAGGGLAHNNLQPYITVNWIVKT